MNSLWKKNTQSQTLESRLFWTSVHTHTIFLEFQIADAGGRWRRLVRVIVSIFVCKCVSAFDSESSSKVTCSGKHLNKKNKKNKITREERASKKKTKNRRKKKKKMTQNWTKKSKTKKRARKRDPHWISHL